VTSYVSEKGNDPEQQHRVSNEIVNRALESNASTNRNVNCKIYPFNAYIFRVSTT